jgi:hypothetical protein
MTHASRFLYLTATARLQRELGEMPRDGSKYLPPMFKILKCISSNGPRRPCLLDMSGKMSEM